MAIYIEDNLPNIRENGLNTLENTTIGGTLAVTGTSTFTGAVSATGAITAKGGIVGADQVVVANTNGTTAVSVFGASGLDFPITITGVFLVSQDTTTGNVTVEAPASTVVCTIAKGATAGALVGATTLSNTSVPAGTNVVVDSSSAGNGRVYITYRAA